MKKAWIGAMAAAAVLAGALCVRTAIADGPALAQGGEGHGGPLRRLISGQIGRLMTLKAEVNLTDAQKQKIKTIVMAHRQEIAAVAKPLVEKRKELRDATLAQNPDEKTIRAAADDLGKAIGDAAVLGSKIKAEVRPVLTPDQIQKMEEFRKQSDQSIDQFLKDFANPS